MLVISDGWERGDTSQLAEEMAALHRRAHSVIWLNPLKGRDGYEPLAAGMAAALPSVDYFLAANTLAFEDVVDVPGFGFLQATCNAGATAASIRYRNPSAQNVRVWADDGGSDPKNLSADSGTSSANTVDSTAFDLVTLYLGSDTLTYRTVVHLAIANTGTRFMPAPAAMSSTWSFERISFESFGNACAPMSCSGCTCVVTM